MLQRHAPHPPDRWLEAALQSTQAEIPPCDQGGWHCRDRHTLIRICHQFHLRPNRFAHGSDPGRILTEGSATQTHFHGLKTLTDRVLRLSRQIIGRTGQPQAAAVICRHRLMMSTQQTINGQARCFTEQLPQRTVNCRYADDGHLLWPTKLNWRVVTSIRVALKNSPQLDEATAILSTTGPIGRSASMHHRRIRRVRLRDDSHQFPRTRTVFIRL
ncbi:hypothetical protein OKW46_001134 [Paraburkholderia sp. WSM4179]|nr:hypothetical protein [Paraburkholderia sp. WSM4179]